MRRPRPAVVMAPLAGAVVGYTLLPVGLARDAGYSTVGAACLVVAYWGLFQQGLRRSLNWLVLLIGFTGWVVGDALVVVQERVLQVSAYPAPSDAVYLVSYGLIGAGLIGIVRRRGGHGDLAAVLDATILATGVAVVAGVFVITPAAMDSTLSTAGKLTSSSYPICDVVLLGVLVRLWTTPGARTTAFRLLAAALGVTLLGDVIYNLRTILTASTASSAANDVMWLAGYVLLAGVMWSPSIHQLSEVAPGLDEVDKPRRRLVVLTGGLLLPGLALLVDGLTGETLAWAVIALGSILLSALVLSRMAGLLSIVSAQSVRLSALARSDPLTGVANRRTWDHELSRACRNARDADSPLTVALLDLDHFKDFNDTFGHPAGDRLLREATAAWSHLLRTPELLSRYGGEEFAVLFPDHTPGQARGRVDDLLASTPGGQTFSAGLAMWDPETDPATALNEADRALYEAKRRGRNQVRLAVDSGEAPLPVPEVVLQPIVDLNSGRPVAVEALSRFQDGEPAGVFAEAYRAGRGPALEASVIAAARRIHPHGLLLTINLAIDALTSQAVAEALTGDLSGIVLEITEHTEAHPSAGLTAAIADYRSRGAVLAVDDWGTGFADVRRLLLLRPEIVKIDISIVQASDALHHRGAIAGLVAWAGTVGARVCAEGIETEAQWQRMRELGVHLGQGFLFGRAAAADHHTELATPVNS